MKRDILARRYIISGRVQGVGFRNYVEYLAGRLELDGYVRNRRDGSVEVFAIGTAERLRELLVALERGPALSRVSNITESPEVPDQKYLGNFIIEVTI